MTRIDTNPHLIHHPHWCDAEDHQQYVDESKDLEDFTVADASRHSLGGGQNFLPEIHNDVDHRVERPGGGRYVLRATRDAHPTLKGGYNGPALVNLLVGVRDLQAELPMTTGEARVLAVQIIALCDKVDLR